MDWRGLLRNRTMLYGVAAAALLGAVVLVRRKQTTGSSSSSPAPDSRGGGIGMPGMVDTTGTDVATWLGNYSQGLQTQLDDYQRGLTDAIEGLRQIPPPAPTPAPGGGFTTMPIPPDVGSRLRPAPTPAPQSNTSVSRLSVPLNFNAYEWVAQVSRSYNPALTWQRFTELNPGLSFDWIVQPGLSWKRPQFKSRTGPVRIR